MWQLTEICSVRDKVSHIKVFLRKAIDNQNKQNKAGHKQANVFRSVDSGHHQNSNAWMLAWLC